VAPAISGRPAAWPLLRRVDADLLRQSVVADPQKYDLNNVASTLPTLAAQELGFEAQHTDLGSIIHSAWVWHQKAHPRIVPGVG
jgi:hypothetical protein